MGVPEGYQDRVSAFISQVERVEVVPDSMAKVIINERTGTVIINQDVRIDPVAITHGNITVSIETVNAAVPASPFSAGENSTQTNTTVDVAEEEKRLIQIKTGQSLDDVVKGLNLLGASPRDMITILQAIKKAGALRAKLEVI